MALFLPVATLRPNHDAKFKRCISCLMKLSLTALDDQEVEEIA
jgi:hypothetical protein